MSILLFLLLIAVHSVYCFYSTSNETDLSRCQVYYSRTGSAYKDHFDLIKPKSNNSEFLLDFHFSVLAPSDAHILIAPSRSTQATDPAYEIVIGAGGNTFCDIRRMQKSQVKESVRIKGLLSALDIRSFWLHITKDGVLEVGREGQDISFINWKDPNPLPTNVISFSTWPGIEAKWFFDCKTDDLKRVKRNLTDLERLRKDLLTKYDPYVRPVVDHNDVTVIQFAPSIKRIFVEEDRSILRIFGVGHMVWNDEKLQWNESAYGGISKVEVGTMEIWKPTIILYNSIDPDWTIYGDSLLTVKSNGEVTWVPILDLKSWCGTDDYRYWPKDERKCDLLFTFWTDFANLQIEYLNQSTLILDHPLSQWSIQEVEVLVNYGKDISADAERNDSYSNSSGPPTLDMCLILKRNYQMYNAIFYTPYFIIVTSFLCIFCVSPFGSAKIALGCFQLILSCFCLIFLGLYLPAHSSTVPHIIQLYSFSVIAGIVAIVLSIIVINLSRIEKKNTFSDLMLKILTSKIVKLMFCLPETKQSFQREQYGKLFALPKTGPQQYYVLLGIIIDRISLVLSLGIAIYSIYAY